MSQEEWNELASLLEAYDPTKTKDIIKKIEDLKKEGLKTQYSFIDYFMATIIIGLLLL